MLLRRMQSLLTRLYDAPVEHDAEDFLISDPRRLREAIGDQGGDGPMSDEQVFVVQEDGGVRIDPDSGQVIDSDMNPIPGLYAAGELVGGIFYFNYPGGTGLMSGAVFGRIAGTGAAAAMRNA